MPRGSNYLGQWWVDENNHVLYEIIHYSKGHYLLVPPFLDQHLYRSVTSQMSAVWRTLSELKNNYHRINIEIRTNTAWIANAYEMEILPPSIAHVNRLGPAFVEVMVFFLDGVETRRHISWPDFAENYHEASDSQRARFHELAHPSSGEEFVNEAIGRTSVTEEPPTFRSIPTAWSSLNED